MEIMTAVLNLFGIPLWLYAAAGLSLFIAAGTVFPWLARNRRMWEDRHAPIEDRMLWGLVAILFIIGDLAFSIGWGQPIVLKRFPRPQLFTQSLIWAKAYGNAQQKKRAKEWCAELEKHDPGHCS